MAATHEVLVLSSSPPRFIPDSDIIVTPPSLRERLPSSPPSPELPSLPDLLKSKPNGLKSGSRAVEIPKGATLGFGSVASLLEDKRIPLGEEDNNEIPQAVPEKKPRTKGARKPRKTASAHDELTESTKAQLKDEGEDGNNLEDENRKAPKPKKQRIKKAEELEANVEEDSVMDSIGLLEHDEAERESTAMSALGKRRAKNKSHVPDTMSAQVSALSTKDLSPTTEETVSVAGLAQAHNAVKPKKSRGRPKKNESDQAQEAKPEKAPKLRQKRTASEEKKPAKDALQARAVTSVVSAHFSRDNPSDYNGEQVPKSPKKRPSDAPLDLDHAMERRRSWTPIRDTYPAIPDPTSKTPIKVSDIPANSTESPGRRELQNKFASLLGGFGYQKGAQERANPETRGKTGEALTKRRRFEMIPNPMPPAAQASKKPESEPKKPDKEKEAGRKKPRTITELATTAYRTPSPESAVELEPRVSTFSAPRVPDTSSAKPKETEAAPPEKRKRAPRSKKPSKASLEKAKKATEKANKQAKLAANKLFSPGTALRKYNNQEVLFGTSSQLARDESPTFMRQIQQALKESEAAQENSPESLRLKRFVESAGLTLPGKKERLWTAAARNLADESFDVYDPGADEELGNAGEDQQFSEDTANGEAHRRAQPHDPSSDFVDIDEYDDLTKRFSETANTVMNVELPMRSSSHPPVRQTTVESRPSSSSSNTNTTLHSVPRSMTALLQISSSPTRLNTTRAKSTLATNEFRPAGPMANKFKTTRGTKATVSLSRATSGGLKVPQALPQGLISIPDNSMREPQVASGYRQEHIIEPPERLPQGLVTPSTKRVRRQRSKQDEGWVHIDEIEDSAEEVTPSPPRRRKIPSESPKLQLSQPGRGDDATVVSASTRAAPFKRVISVPSDEQMAAVFTIITNTIKTGPPSVQPGSLTWHEKILLYDPVVVEDLSEWLNKKGIRVHMEVAVKEKKKPERKGKKAKADNFQEAEGDDEITNMPRGNIKLVEVPLQPWVVQRWCEENSVCCIWKDNEKKRKGWKARTG